MMRGALIRGTYAAIVAAAAAYAISRWGFHRLYYLGVLLPTFAVLSILVAWFLRLKDDGFFRVPRRARGEEGALAPRPAAPGAGDRASGRRACAILLVVAAELAMLATALYVFAGIGAHYY